MNQNDYWVGVRSCEHEEELNKSGVRVHLNDELWEARGRFHMKLGWGRGGHVFPLIFLLVLIWKTKNVLSNMVTV